MRNFEVVMEDGYTFEQMQRTWDNEIAPSCTKIIQAYKEAYKVENSPSHSGRHTYLLRGSKTVSDTIQFRETLRGRRPKDTHETVHDQINAVLDNYGFKARRDNSIFTTSKEKDARSYGQNVSMIFPVDGFDFLWSTVYPDLFEGVLSAVQNLGFYWINETKKFYRYVVVFRDIAAGIHHEFEKEVARNPKAMMSPIEDKLTRSLEVIAIQFGLLIKGMKTTMDTSDLLGLILNTIELLKKYNGPVFSLHPKVLVLSSLQAAYRLTRRIINLKNTTKLGPAKQEKIINLLQPDSKNLVDAILSGHEVLIHGQYYQIPSGFESVVDNLLAGRPANAGFEHLLAIK